ncbi:hypothetical protein [Streptomyces sp. NBC_01373]|uniref:hypothetical protein n=1 Tax=unclassified Streptomyces TaxID=2593676 RepID=UPI00224C91C1|nr:hypothetical protein [Streptomyces sp. NBC_01373]MCX4706861.1 hypothetical protein [Streptomyces sp. NBC_01373]
MAALQESVEKARSSRGEDADVHELPTKKAAAKEAAKKQSATKTAQTAKAATKKAAAKKTSGRGSRSACPRARRTGLRLYADLQQASTQVGSRG